MNGILGHIRIGAFLKATNGRVFGQVTSDAKMRSFSAEYDHERASPSDIKIVRKSGTGDALTVRSDIPIDRELVAFFGLYSGDGSKGSESPPGSRKLNVSVSFSQVEPNLILFAKRQMERLFPNQLRFTFSLGEDSAYFMGGNGLDELKRHYGDTFPAQKRLEEVLPKPSAADSRYLSEERDVDGTSEEHLAFYYQHKRAMKEIMIRKKEAGMAKIGIRPSNNIKITASLRRPYKKGARAPGRSSRADEMYIGGLSGMGELFLKILFEVESSIRDDSRISSQGLVEWNGIPSELGELLDMERFFTDRQYGQVGGERPVIATKNRQYLVGRWPRSSDTEIKKTVRLNPLFAYAAGLYMAEGVTRKSTFFSMFARKPEKFGVGFTSSEDSSMFMITRCLSLVFRNEDVLTGWKIKVGSQYFPELVMIGMKNGVPLLRGGSSGDGKARTMEISLSVKPWGLTTCPSLAPYSDLYTHVEPTGAGVARIHFQSSSRLAKWIFPLFMYVMFSIDVPNPRSGFAID